MFVSHMHICFIHCKEVVSFLWSWSINGTVRNRVRKLLVTYIQTRTQSKYIPKVLQDHWKSSRGDNRNNKYNRLLCFRYNKVSHDYWMLDNASIACTQNSLYCSSNTYTFTLFLVKATKVLFPVQLNGKAHACEACSSQ